MLKQESTDHLEDMYITIKHYMGYVIRIRRSDGYLNAPDMCKAANKDYYDYSRLNSTREFLQELSVEMKISIDQLEEKIKSGPMMMRGTWLHPSIATDFAAWISAKFRMKISLWVDEWKATSRQNLLEYYTTFSVIKPFESRHIERQFQSDLQKKLGGQIEVRTPIGVIDLLTEDCVIEVKNAANWKAALGQVLSYSEFHPEKKRVIALFSATVNDTDIIRQICKKYSVEVMFIDNN